MLEKLHTVQSLPARFWCSSAGGPSSFRPPSHSVSAVIRATTSFSSVPSPGGRTILVSADADLLTLNAVQGIPILDAPGFWKTLEGADR